MFRRNLLLFLIQAVVQRGSKTYKVVLVSYMYATSFTKALRARHANSCVTCPEGVCVGSRRLHVYNNVWSNQLDIR